MVNTKCSRKEQHSVWDPGSRWQWKEFSWLTQEREGMKGKEPGKQLRGGTERTSSSGRSQ